MPTVSPPTAEPTATERPSQPAPEQLVEAPVPALAALLGNIAAGYTRQEQQAWEAQIASGSALLVARNADVVALVEARRRRLLDGLEEKLRRQALSETDIRIVRDALVNPREQFLWFMAQVEGPERYRLGHRSALAINVIQFLQQWERDHGVSDLIDEYLLHEALERTQDLGGFPRAHRLIMDVTSAIFGRRHAVDKAPGETQLGRALRAFIQAQLVKHARQ